MAKIRYLNKYPGFTLVETIGALAVITILAGVLILIIFNAIKSSRINATIEAYHTFCTAVADHIGKWGRFSNTNGVPLTPGVPPITSAFDAYVLLPEGRITATAKMKIKISDQTYDYPRVKITSPISYPGNGGWYDFDGDGISDTKNARAIAELFIFRVPLEDARELSLRLDGERFSEPIGVNDQKGRVTYSKLVWEPNRANVYIYIAHY